ncbi:MAG: hypothetical protein HY047_21225 [Acidobacteria bacterium]|nr:hypothetical protein [Acidobacteriota bacterium]
MRRLMIVCFVFAILGVGLRVADAQIVVTDPATTIKNILTAAIKSQIVDTLTEQARQIRRMARRLSVFTDLAKYAVADPTRWRSYRYQDLNLYANPYVEALNFGDADGRAYEAIARTRAAAGPVLAELGEDNPAAEASMLAALATLDLADSTLITGTDQNGRLRAGGKLEMRAVDALERDVVDPSSAQSATAVVDKISAAVLLETRNRQARTQFLTAIVEQLLVDNKRARDAEAATMNMQLGRLRDGRPAGLSLLAGAGNDLRAWKQP